jgi:hypothetical protein
MAFALTLAQPAQQKPAKPAVPAAKPAADSGLDRNVAFGFRYRIPDG